MSHRLFRATIDGHVCLVEIDRDDVRVKPEGDDAARATNATNTSEATNADDAAEHAFTVTPFDASVARVQQSGTPLALDVHTVLDTTAGSTGGAVWTFVDGEVFRIDLEDAERGGRSRRAVGDEALSAPMPATVIKLMAEAGQTVEAGDTLLLLEAMKMEMPIRAPRAARIKAFRCKAGELVQPGVPLVDLEPA